MFPPLLDKNWILLTLQLYSNKSYTLPLFHRKNIVRLDLNPQGNLLLTVDEDGRAILTNYKRRIVIYHISFKGPADALKFSPSGQHFAVGIGRRLQLWQTPSVPGTDAGGDLEYAPFVLHRELTGHFDTIQNIEWSSDSRFILTSSKDLTARVWSLDPQDGFEPTTLAGHRQGVKAAFFTADQEAVRHARASLSRRSANFLLDIHCERRWCAFPVGIYHKKA
jgi:periodic tryptophan protein 2